MGLDVRWVITSIFAFVEKPHLGGLIAKTWVITKHYPF